MHSDSYRQRYWKDTYKHKGVRTIYFSLGDAVDIVEALVVRQKQIFAQLYFVEASRVE